MIYGNTDPADLPAGPVHNARQKKPFPGGTPQLKGLILCGGQSRRMQTDKSLLEYRGAPQWLYVMNLLAPFVEETWISCRQQQLGSYRTSLVLPDDPQAGISGPAAGILAAHRRFPQVAWLVIACDLPLVTAASLQALLAARNPGCKATAVVNPGKGWPEPLLAVWEPAGLAVLARHIRAGHNHPRKTLYECAPALVNLSMPAELFNANTPAEKALAERTLAERTLAERAAAERALAEKTIAEKSAERPAANRPEHLRG